MAEQVVQPSHAGAPAVRRLPSAVSRLSFLRYLLIFPLLTAFERKARRSLRWRLAESHLRTVFLSVLAISVLGAVGLLVISFVQDPVRREPSNEASDIAGMVQDMGWAVGLGDPAEVARVNSALAAVASGEISPNKQENDVNLIAELGAKYKNIRTVSIVGFPETPGPIDPAAIQPGGIRVLASSDPDLVGKSAIQIGPAALGVSVKALSGERSTSRNSVMHREGRRLVTGAYPIVQEIDEVEYVVGAVVVDKSQRTLPSGGRLVLLALTYVGQIGLTIAVLVGVPAIPVGTLIGIRRARAIGKPVTELATAAESLAAGDLSARVRPKGADEVASLGRAFNAMADRLQATMALEAAARARAEQLLAANRDLVANVSHELRTPVALVRGHLEALAGEPAKCEDYTRIALRETDRLENLVNDLFQLTRLEIQSVKLERAPFDAGAAAREAAESLAGPAQRDAGLTIAADVAPGDLRAMGDRARLVQVLQNLIRNAIRYTPEGGIILVGAGPTDDPGRIALTVRDTGTGIGPEDLPHVFDRFYRAEQSRSRTSGGAGLGLSIAKGLIESMGGTIAVESEIGEGTLFTIHLPRAAQDGAEPPSRRAPAVATAD